jgi:hypothetical protein
MIKESVFSVISHNGLIKLNSFVFVTTLVNIEVVLKISLLSLTISYTIWKWCSENKNKR